MLVLATLPTYPRLRIIGDYASRSVSILLRRGKEYYIEYILDDFILSCLYARFSDTLLSPTTIIFSFTRDYDRVLGFGSRGSGHAEPYRAR
jgi:hypothetical protein